ncbi:MAG: ATP synthase subunit I [Thermodesulfobacteriota bacterium]|nr:ATP synthase subunit I [Desulfovibrionales bacterium]MDQ7837344.1 ATP synthase subunit I [Thermodesulfobacteriota bacterium]
MSDFWRSTQLIKKVQVPSLILCLILTIFGVIFVSIDFALGILVGGIIAGFNFYWLQTALRKIFDQQVVFGHKAIYYVKYYLRLIIIGGVLYELIMNKMVHPLGLITGLSVVVINIMVIAFTELWKIIRTKEAT